MLPSMLPLVMDLDALMKPWRDSPERDARRWYDRLFRACAGVCLALVVGFASGAAWASELERKHGLPRNQANDVFGVEPGMSVAEVRQTLARRFPSAFGGCAGQMEAPRPLLCRITAEAYYQEIAGRDLVQGVRPGSPSGGAAGGSQSAGAHISNLVLTVTESDAKRSIEVFFGAVASGRQAYRISGIMHYGAGMQPAVSAYRDSFAKKYGAMDEAVARGRGSVAGTYFAAGLRLRMRPAGMSSGAEANGCQELAQAASGLHDMRAMLERDFARRLVDRPCDTMITLALAPGQRADEVGISTIVVFDAARLAHILEVEAKAVRDALGVGGGSARPPGAKDF